MSAVLIFVLVADPTSESAASAIAASTADARDDKTIVQLERVSALPTDAVALRRATESGASDVFEISWPGSEHVIAHVHAHVDAHLSTKPAWIDRDLAFDVKSPAWERGRAVGLAIASMIPERLPDPPTPRPPPPPTPTPPPPLDAATAPDATAPIVAPPIVAPTPPIAVMPEILVPKSIADAPVGATTTPLSPFAIGLAFEWIPAASPVGATSGAALELGAQLGDRLEAHVAARARFASVSAIGARTEQLAAGVGAKVTIVQTSAARLDAAADLRLARVSATRTNDAGASETAHHFNPVGAISVGASFPLSASLVAFFGVSGELPFGETTLTVNGEISAELPRFAIVGDAGARWRF